VATVLVADDDRNTRLLVCTVLGHAGHTVLEASNGDEALEQAVAHEPDLILLDLFMPSKSGPELLRALRAQPQTKATPVALYTASPMNSALRDLMEIYAIGDVVPKPSEPAALLAAVERALLRAFLTLSQ
jgi:CheY-like chemotaxis protein